MAGGRIVTGHSYALRMAVPCESRFAVRGVPTIELWASGASNIFHRMAGIVDSGATRTLLGTGAHALLGIAHGSGVPDQMKTIAGTLEYELYTVQFRLYTREHPPISVCLEVGLCETIEENLFGADLLRYFTLALSREEVVFMAN
jgi:hypothetical protein